jgi:hypothetical protein
MRPEVVLSRRILRVKVAAPEPPAEMITVGAA